MNATHKGRIDAFLAKLHYNTPPDVHLAIVFTRNPISVGFR